MVTTVISPLRLSSLRPERLLLSSLGFRQSLVAVGAQILLVMSMDLLQGSIQMKEISVRTLSALVEGTNSRLDRYCWKQYPSILHSGRYSIPGLDSFGQASS